ncbi:MAG: DUF502 domain-containing protein [Paracoccus sp. (in: a-proteobacteria)]|uniref:DUF502 domain-containing protein n=2 Tax=unclassified Paracoccus (in: a-proteobacteria) TaxID=2688777 RepID=UPI000C3F7058|nr:MULTISPECIES: DUF502 domain-containing protein [unclassified Paracoccus (in: a-proteobacteria)]MAN56264.1 hypothetical protein [Paracoccus sp. (in: a-proteobacteria)]MBA49021.1 hypothetical protein [Paracoccus sp. (in: a-proteobacteria)]MDB2552363.1 DUF502 domain-containing protein [Paracoccus sp. (in: a-proteobacteria)]
MRMDPALPPRRPGLLGMLRSNFLAGLVVVAPIGITVWLIWTLTGWMDSWVLPMVPPRWRPENYIGIPLRGVGVVFFLLFTVLIGWVAKGWVGRALLRTGERIVARMPIVRSVYGAVKQIAETILSQDEARFDRACMIEYPRKGLWALGFVAGPAKGELVSRTADDLIAVFVPTTPNPTSGFLIYVPASDVTILSMSVEDAAKLIISAGLVYPAQSSKTTPREDRAGDRNG